MNDALPKVYLVRHGETSWTISGQHTGRMLVFAHRDILRILIARWVALPALEARRLYLKTVSVSTLGYDHDLDEPVIRMLNDVRR